MAKHIVQTGQDIFDVAIQNYGDATFYLDVITSNNLNADSFIAPAQELTVNNENQGDKQVKDYYKKINFIVVNGSFEDIHSSAGDYNTDFNDDYLN